MSQSRVFTLDEVSQHNCADSCWVIIDGFVYNVTQFAALHPGGTKMLVEMAGQDVSDVFHALHNSTRILTKYAKLCIGKVQDDIATTRDVEEEEAVLQHSFGSVVPFGEPYWYQGFHSPYYNESHKQFRDKVRRFVEAELIPFVHVWDERGTYPPELHRKAYEAGIYGATWPVEYGGTPPAHFDPFHDLILVDELSRCAAGGVLWACFFSFGIALPPVLSVGSDFLKHKVAQDVISGKKIMSLAVTEPWVGSDVANLRTTAVLRGDDYIVNGAKKFITSGTKAHYFTTAVRTGNGGTKGISLLLIERDMPGVRIRRQKTQGWWISGTAYIILEDVRVPASHLIGEVDKGWKAIMYNFNHERFVLAAMSNRYARVCLEEAISYGRKRKTFNKRLIDHQVIRHKVAEMARRVEATHALLEQIAYQIKCNVAQPRMSGIIALAKVQATKTMEFCARESSQVFGGNAFLRGGIGEKVERLYREVRVNAVGGGSEEILLDLAMKMAKL